MEKRGSAHLEMIMAFVIFVSFTLFLLYTLQPPRKQVIDDSALLSLKDRFFENITINLTIVLVNHSLESGPCKPQDISGNSISFPVNGSDGKFSYVYISNEIQGNLDNCTANKHSIGYTDFKQVVSNNSISLLQNLYNNDYDGLKEYFDLPRGVDFAVESNNYDLAPNAGTPTIGVVSYNYQKQLIFANGSLILEDFIIRTW